MTLRIHDARESWLCCLLQLHLMGAEPHVRRWLERLRHTDVDGVQQRLLRRHHLLRRHPSWSRRANR